MKNTFHEKKTDFHKHYIFSYFRTSTRPNKRLTAVNTRMTRKEREMQELEKMIAKEEKSMKNPYKNAVKSNPSPSPKLKREKSKIKKIYEYEDDFDDDFDDEKPNDNDDEDGYDDDFDDFEMDEEKSRSTTQSPNYEVERPESIVSKRSSSNMSETMQKFEKIFFY